jgi:predicted GIY-YIG superfamily endonuclease
MEGYFVYILAGRKKGVLYVGMAKNLKRRISEHKNDGKIKGKRPSFSILGTF